jgi:hypothetical protein
LTIPHTNILRNNRERERGFLYNNLSEIMWRSRVCSDDDDHHHHNNNKGSNPKTCYFKATHMLKVETSCRTALLVELLHVNKQGITPNNGQYLLHPYLTSV